jgi:hypothetical protein
MPHGSVFIAWQLKVPEFRNALLRAREYQGEAWGELAVHEAMAAHDKESSMVARVRAETLLKAAGRRDPARWGERRDSGPSLSVTIATPVTPARSALDGEYVVVVEAEAAPSIDDLL